MRHRKNFNHLGRKTGHRKAMLANMASSLIMHKRISTTTAKAKALRIYVEPLITKSKDDSTHSRRVVFSYLQNKEAVSELFREVSTKILDRPGGYTRILKTGTRLGDNADMCIIELVDYNENLLSAQDDSKSKSSRRRKRGSKKAADSTESKGTASKEKQSKVEKKESLESKSDLVEVDTIEEPKAEIGEPTIEDKPIDSKADEGTEEGKK